MPGQLAGTVGTLVVVGGLLSAVCTLTSQGSRQAMSLDGKAELKPLLLILR